MKSIYKSSTYLMLVERHCIEAIFLLFNETIEVFCSRGTMSINSINSVGTKLGSQGIKVMEFCVQSGKIKEKERFL